MTGARASRHLQALITNDTPLAMIAVGVHSPTPQSDPDEQSCSIPPAVLHSAGSMQCPAPVAPGLITEAFPHTGAGSNKPEIQQTLPSLLQPGLAMQSYLFAPSEHPPARSVHPTPGQQAWLALLHLSFPPLARGQSKN